MADEVRRAKIVKATDAGDDAPVARPRRKARTPRWVVPAVLLSFALVAGAVAVTAYRVVVIYKQVKQEVREEAVVAVKTHTAWLGMNAKTAAEVLAFAGPPSSSTGLSPTYKGKMTWRYRDRVYNEVTRKDDTTAVLHIEDGVVFNVVFVN